MKLSSKSHSAERYLKPEVPEKEINFKAETEIVLMMKYPLSRFGQLHHKQVRSYQINVGGILIFYN